MTGPLHLRRLSDHDVPALQELLEADPGYARRVTGAAPGPGEAADLLSGRPPGLPADRLVGSWPEITTVRAAIVATNATAADPYWAALGYRPTEPPTPYQVGETATQVTVWTRPASPAASPGGLSAAHPAPELAP
jgi:hypothetical protein